MNKLDTIPMYTKKEEIFNAVSHIVGGAISLIGLIIGIIFSKNTIICLSMIIYGLSLILLYTMSSLYHFLGRNKAKLVFRIFDHCSIFLLIAGTYTPICLGSLQEKSPLGIIILIILWVLAIIGITLNAIMMNKVKIVSMVIYLTMGWCAIIVLKPVIELLGLKGFLWILGGGIIYTIGAILYMLAKKGHILHGHCIWHIFVLMGSLIQYIGILLYVVLK